MQHKIARQLAIALIFIVSGRAGAQIVGERAVSAPLYGIAPYGQYLQGVATDGENFLAVWQDYRGLLPNGEVYVARVSASGELLDPTGIRLARDAFNAFVVFAGDSYSVFWTQSQTYVARISRDGKLIDGPRLVGLPVNDVWAAASNGRRIVISSRDRLFILDDRATLLEQVAITAGDFAIYTNKMLATNGSAFMLTWGGNTTYALPLDADGHPSGTPRIAAHLQSSQRLLSDGESYVLLISEAGLLKTIHLSADGERSDPQLILWSKGQLAWDGNEYLLVSNGQGTTGTPAFLEAIRLDRTGKPVDSVPFRLLDRPIGTMLFASARGGLLLFTDGRTEFEENSHIRAHVLVPPQLSVAGAVLVSQSAQEQRNPAVASSGRNILVAWREDGAFYANRFSVDGTPLAEHGIRLQGPSFEGNGPSVVFDGANYVVAWSGAGGTYAARITESGVLLDPNAVSLGAGTFLGAGTDGVGTLIVIARPGTLEAMRLDRALSVTGSVVASAEEPKLATASVGWDGTEWLIAYERLISTISPHDYASDVRAVRLSGTLNVLDPTPIAFAGGGYQNLHPLVVTAGDGFTVFWTQSGSRARRISRAGNLLGDPVLVGSGAAFDATWDGARYAVAFTTSERSWVAHLAADLKPSGDELPLTQDRPQTAALARAGERLVAAYARRALEPRYGGVLRAFIRTPMPVPARGRAVGR